VRTTVTLSDDLIANAQELTGITERTELLRAASTGIASVIADDEISPVYIIPGAFDTRVADAVAKAVRKFAEEE